MRRWRPSLKLRLMMLITLLIALFCMAAGIYIVRRAHNDIRGEVFSATDLVERYLDAQLALTRMEWRNSGEALPKLHLSRLSDVRHVDVYFYNAIGHLLETSAPNSVSMPKAPFWFAWLVQRSFKPIPDVHRFVSFDGSPAGALVIHPDPAFEIDEIWNVTRGLFGLLLVFALLVNFLVWWAVGRALRPVERVRIALNALSAGKLDQRLPEFNLPELSSLSHDFNRLATKLELGTAENHRLAKRLIQTQEDERKAIARELHDEIGQCVTAIHADATTIRDSDHSGDRIIHESTMAIIEVATRIKNMVRGMLHRLRPTQIEELGLAPALRELTGAFAQRNPETRCSLEIDPTLRELNEDTAIVTYRVIQEALTNITRHAKAKSVDIKVARKANRVVLDLCDDGIGFDTDQTSRGLGLLGMRERVIGQDGHWAIDTTPGQGTRITMNLPLPDLEKSST